MHIHPDLATLGQVIITWSTADQLSVTVTRDLISHCKVFGGGLGWYGGAGGVGLGYVGRPLGNVESKRLCIWLTVGGRTGYDLHRSHKHPLHASLPATYTPRLKDMVGF